VDVAEGVAVGVAEGALVGVGVGWAAANCPAVPMMEVTSAASVAPGAFVAVAVGTVGAWAIASVAGAVGGWTPPAGAARAAAMVALAAVAVTLGVGAGGVGEAEALQPARMHSANTPINRLPPRCCIHMLLPHWAGQARFPVQPTGLAPIVSNAEMGRILAVRREIQSNSMCN
jgi:hypothetical protein